MAQEVGKISDLPSVSGAEMKAECRLPTLPERAPGPRAHTVTGWEHS